MKNGICAVKGIEFVPNQNRVGGLSLSLTTVFGRSII